LNPKQPSIIFDAVVFRSFRRTRKKRLPNNSVT
jgi:hypothetical protein